MRQMRFFCVALIAKMVALANDAAAASSAVDSKNVAPVSPGARLYAEGRYADALEEFELAYKNSRDMRFLYNVAQCNLALGRSVDAVDAFERYLREGNDRIGVDRRNEVVRSIALQQKSIGSLEIHVSPADAIVRVDGRVVGRRALVEPIRLPAGEHVVAASLDGHRPVERVIKLKGSEERHVELTLVPDAAPSRGKGQLAIECSIPEVQVIVDEQTVTSTPVSLPLLVEEGRHTLRFERVGYRSTTMEIHAKESAAIRVECGMAVDALNATTGGRLMVHSSEPNSEVLVDDHHASAQLWVPIGLHFVEVRRTGFTPWKQSVRVEPGRIHPLWVTLQLTSERRRELYSVSRVRRDWAFGLGAAAIASIGAALPLGIWNLNRHSKWVSERDYVESPANRNNPDWESRRGAANDLEQSMRAFDVINVGLAVAGGLLLAGGSILYLGGEDPSRYEEPKKKESLQSAIAWPERASETP